MHPQAFGYCDGDGVRQRDRACLPALGRRRHDPLTLDVLHLLPDLEAVPQEVGVLDPQPEGFALAQAQPAATTAVAW